MGFYEDGGVRGRGGVGARRKGAAAKRQEGGGKIGNLRDKAEE